MLEAPDMTEEDAALSTKLAQTDGVVLNTGN